MAVVALVFLAACPLVFRIIKVDFVSPDITNAQGSDTGPQYDAFTYIKMAVIYAATAALAALFCARVAMRPAQPAPQGPAQPAPPAPPKRRRADALEALARRAPEFALAALCATLLASFFASPFKAVALHGMVTTQSGVLAHICYALLFFFGWKVLSRCSRPALFIAPVYAAGAANALISLLSFYGVRTVEFAPIRLLLGLPPNARVAESQSFTSTFGNINYLSGFGGVLFAIAFAHLLFGGGEGSKPDKPDAGFLQRGGRLAAMNGRLAAIDGRLAAMGGRLAMVAVAFSITVTSLSSSGFLTALVMAPAIAAAALALRVPWRRLALAAAALALCAAVYAPLAAHNPAVAEETIGMFRALWRTPAAAVQADAAAPPPALPPMGLAAAAAPQPATEPGSEGWLAPPVALPDVPPASVAPGSGRLYIWRETLKLIKARPLAGYGMDTLTYAFPQHDVAMVAGMGQYNVTITKPHNIFIDYAYGAGLPALVSFLALCALTLTRFARRLARGRRLGLPPPPAAAMCLMAAWAAYLLQGLVNDDLVSTTPVWWMLGGVAFGLSEWRRNPSDMGALRP